MHLKEMTSQSKNFKNITFRILGGVLGLIFIVFGILVIAIPAFNTFLEIVNGIAGLLFGAVLLKYAIAGKSVLNDIILKS